MMCAHFADVHTLYRRAGNFRDVYISRSSWFDRIHESLSCEFVNITIQMHNTSMQIAKLKLRKCLFKREIAKFNSANIFRSTVVNDVALWIIGYFLFTRLLIIARATYVPHDTSGFALSIN